jgi:hypothetical protein
MKKRDYRVNSQPLIPASESLPELTIKVFVFSILLAAFLAASNAYLALKIGTTISASIPASVLAISVLRLFKNSNVLECNIIQTAASGGEGVAAAVAFSLPAMVLLHVWSSFPYWEVACITALSDSFCAASIALLIISSLCSSQYFLAASAASVTTLLPLSSHHSFAASLAGSVTKEHEGVRARVKHRSNLLNII